jgi:hypothetical protein
MGQDVASFSIYFADPSEVVDRANKLRLRSRPEAKKCSKPLSTSKQEDTSRKVMVCLVTRGKLCCFDAVLPHFSDLSL